MPLFCNQVMSSISVSFFGLGLATVTNRYWYIRDAWRSFTTYRGMLLPSTVC